MANTGGLAGQVLGQYELRELLGRGGMGAVYRAYQHSLKREVAVKVLSDQLTDEPGYLERFNAEARTAAALEHPHIVPIHDFGTQDDLSYVVMRYLTGGSLHERMRTAVDQGRGSASMAEIADLLAQIASALDYAHHEGVVHRDIKPQNIMFDNHGKAYVVDFGIAKLLHQTAMTISGMALGSPSYMPPEQWRGEGVSGASDQYALAVTIYALVAGRLPFEGDSQQQLMYKHLSELPPALSVSRPDLPPALTLVINRALAKDPADRFPNCTQFSQAFAASVEGIRGEATNYFSFKLPKTERKPSTVTARPPDAAQGTPSGSQRSTPSPTAPRQPPTIPVSQPTVYPTASAPKAAPNRNRMLALVALAVVIAVGGLVAAFSNRGGTPEDNSTPTRASGVALLTTETPEPTSTDNASETIAPTSTDDPTLTDEPSATTAATMDALAIAQATRGALQTADAVALQETAFQATIDSLQTALYLEDLTATATQWTPTPTLVDTATIAPSATVPAVPTSNLTAFFRSQQTGSRAFFTNTSTGQIASVLWDFGDGVTSTARSPFHDYTESGTFTVSLTIIDPFGNSSFTSEEITVEAPPVETPTVSSDLQTATRRAESFANVTATAAAFQSLEPSATRTLLPFNQTATRRAEAFANVTATAAAVSTLSNVQLTGTKRAINAATSDAQLANVTATAAARSSGLSASFSTRQDGLRVVFTNTSTGQLASISWQFGDGLTSTLRSPFHDYLAYRTYDVTLTVVDNGGNQDTLTQTINILAPESSSGLSASFSTRQDGLRVVFTNTSTGQLASVSWDFGDGTTSTLRSPFHDYLAYGTYDVSLTVVDNGGNTSFTSQAITIGDKSPVLPGFGYDGTAERTVFFRNETTGDALSFLWDFGDGSTSTLRDPEHTYAASGIYTITLTVGSVSGQVTIEAQIAVIAPSVGTASFGWTNNGLAVQFENQSGEDALSFLWAFGDGTMSTDRNPSHTYEAGGMYVVILTVGTLGGQSTAEQVVVIEDVPPPVVDAYYVQSDVTTAAFLFSFSGDITSVLWHFGDGEHSEESAPVYEYEEPGTYEVELEAIGPGGTASVFETVVIADGCTLVWVESGDNTVRSEPSDGAAELTTMDPGDELFTSRAIVDNDGETWYYTFHDAEIGWVKASVMRVIEGECPTA